MPASDDTAIVITIPPEHLVPVLERRIGEIVAQHEHERALLSAYTDQLRAENEELKAKLALVQAERDATRAMKSKPVSRTKR